MDNGLDVDDLFGDPALGLGLSSPSPPPKGLAQRLDEMRLLGCCQYVLIALDSAPFPNQLAQD
jgi:mediator of RNA polymerase II transcription subunit 16, fungi type